MLEDAALTEAQQLTATLNDDEVDLEASYLLGWLHWYRYQALPEGRDREDFESAVARFTQCFIHGTSGLPELLLPYLVGQVALTAMRLHERALGSSDQDMLTGAVQLWQRILGATPTDHEDHAAYLSNLGDALRTRFERTGAQADLERAVAAGHQAIQATPDDHPNRATILNNLGIALQARFERTGEQADLDQAITTVSQAIQATPNDHPNRAKYLNNLGNALRARFKRTGDQADLDQAIIVGQQAVQATPTDHPTRATILNNLGIALQARFERTGEQADLDQAITTVSQAIQATPDDHPDRAAYLSNLGGDLRARFERTGDQADLDQAIIVGWQAVQGARADHPDRAAYLSNLGIALQARFERTGAQADLDQAIIVGQQAVQATSTDHPYYAGHLSNLGNALQARFERTGAQADLDQAITTVSQAIQATPDDHPNRAAYLSNLGSDLRARFERTGDQADLDQAIIVGQQAVQATPTDHPNRAGRLSNLGNALRTRFERTGAQADLDQAIIVGQQAVQATPTDHPNRAGHLTNLGNALRTRFERTGAQADRDRAVAAYAEAAEVGSAAPSARIHAGRAAASLIADMQPGRAADLLEGAVRLLPEITPRQLERSDQQHAISAFPGLGSKAAALVLADTSAPADRRAVRALQLLEAARAVLLSQALHTRSDLTDLRDQYPGLAARFVELRDLLDRPSDTVVPNGTVLEGAGFGPGPATTQTHDRHRLAREFTDLLARIRALKGFASFAQPPAAQDLLDQATGGPVVVFNISSHRSDALLLTTSGITALQLPGLDQATVIDQVNTFHQALTATTDPDADRIGAQATIRNTLGWLWDNATEPVLHALGHYHPPAPGTVWPRVWWAPGGLLGLLPVHAAGHYTRTPDIAHRTVMDRVVSSYTPTIGALAHARRHTTTPGPHDRSLIVAMPTTPGIRGRLDNVPAEAAMLQTRLPRPDLLAEPDPSGTATTHAPPIPTKTAVLARLDHCRIAHFACHGSTHPTDPSASRLLLHDHRVDPFTVAALAPLALDHAHLAYLSACSTAFTADTRLLDEAIHLASAFQLAGFPHVIGTLWPIDDALAVTIADTFYTTLTGRDGALNTSRAAHALHHAIRTARATFPMTPSLWAAHIHAGV
ncbi:CHAT domain-containing protein [Actinomadura sp. WMMA1423]|uniref:CHAT domain-containing tetratricopeptide repeat protein n=1 Tax=Actinomadura sp. WMMA1423 TaxID=2591108 RepID=UPI00197AB9C1|nr:CHAT domain-containing protein [Actinomadura sp. WMMA1423]